MTIQDRIEKHTNEVEKLQKRSKLLEMELKNIPGKIRFHLEAIANLQTKGTNKAKNWKFATPNGNLTKSEGDAHIG